MEEEFKFLLCARCQKESQNPKLLVCLHTVCSECLEESKPIDHCPVCRISIQRTGGAAFQDNVLFANLQAKLNTFRKIATGSDLVCDLCKGEAEFWCAECTEFLCMKCYEAHQWYLKQKSHEAQKLADLKTDTATKFLEGARKSSNLFCSNSNHNNQGPTSIYCRGCQKPLCCSCALLDSNHSSLYCDIREEIQLRKDELGRMNAGLMEKKQSYEKIYGNLQQRVQDMEKKRSGIREWIQNKVAEMIQQIQKEGDGFLEEVDKKLSQEHQEIEEKLERMGRIVKRLETSEELVEKVNRFASDQEVMDMHPFVKASLEEFRKEKLPAIGFHVHAENFADIKEQLMALFKRVIGWKGDDRRVTLATSTPVPPDKRGKRHLSQSEKSVQASGKLLKFEGHSCEAERSAGQCVWDPAPGPRGAHLLVAEGERRGAIEPAELSKNCPSELRESDDARCVTPSTSSPVPLDNPGVLHEDRNQSKAQGTPKFKYTAKFREGTWHLNQSEKAIQASGNLMKFEDHSCDAEGSSGQGGWDSAPGPHGARLLVAEGEQRGAVEPVEPLANSPLELCELEVTSIIISSSEDTDGDTVVE